MESEIRQAEERLRDAMLTSDLTALDALIDDQLLFVAPTGVVIRKIDDLALHRSGAQRFTRLDLDEVFVSVHETTAITVVLASLAGSSNGTAFEGRFRYTRTWVRGEKGWRVVAGSVCPVAG
jgi:ketosteroid isomerase-like protein